MYKLSSLLFVLLLSCHTSATQQCPDLNIISTQGKYLVLDSATLTTKDVGDLRVAGIYELNVLGKNSNADNFTIGMDYIYDLKEKKQISPKFAYLLPTNWRNRFNQSELIQLDMFKNTQFTRITNSNLYLSVTRKNNKADLVLFNSRINTIKTFNNIDMTRTPDLVACKHDNNVIVAGRNKLITIKDQHISTEPFTTKLHKQHNIRTNEQCNLLISARTNPPAKDINKQQANFQVFSMNDNEVIGSFNSNVIGNMFLFEGGRFALQQHTKVTFFPNSTITGSIDDTAQYSLFDTNTGKTIANNKISEHGKATKMICAATNPTLVLKDKKQIHLLDAKTLTIKQSKHIPFEQFFVM